MIGKKRRGGGRLEDGRWDERIGGRKMVQKRRV